MGMVEMQMVVQQVALRQLRCSVSPTGLAITLGWYRIAEQSKSSLT